MRGGFAEADERRTVNLAEQNPHEKIMRKTYYNYK